MTDPHTQLEAARERVKELEEALLPFADKARVEDLRSKTWNGGECAESRLIEFPMKYFRGARVALAGKRS